MKGRIAKLQPRLDAVKAKLLGDGAARRLDGLVGAPDAAQRFAALSLERRRGIIDLLIDVKLLRAARRGQKFCAEQVAVDWKS